MYLPVPGYPINSVIYRHPTKHALGVHPRSVLLKGILELLHALTELSILDKERPCHALVWSPVHSIPGTISIGTKTNVLDASIAIIIHK